MNSELIRLCIALEMPLVSAQNIRTDVGCILQHKTTFNDAAVKQVAESLHFPPESDAGKISFVDDLYMLHSCFPALPLRIQADDTVHDETQLDVLENKVKCAALLCGMDCKLCLSIAGRSKVARAIFYLLWPARANPEYYLSAAQQIEQIPGQKYAILAQLAVAHYEMHFARAFHAKRWAKAAALRLDKLLGRCRYLLFDAGLYSIIQQLFDEMNALSKDAVVSFQADLYPPACDFLKLYLYCGVYPRQYMDFYLVDRNSVLDDHNLLEVKQYLLASRAFVGASLRAEKISSRAESVLELMKVVPRACAEFSQLFAAFPWIAEFAAPVKQEAARNKRLQTADLTEHALAHSLSKMQWRCGEIAGFYKDLADSEVDFGVEARVHVIQDMAAAVQTCQATVSRFSSNGAFERCALLIQHYCERIAELDREIREVGAGARKIAQETNMSTYIRKNELQQLIYDARLNIFDVYDSDVGEFVVKLVDFFVQRVESAELELGVLERRADILRGAETELSMSFGPEKCKEAREFCYELSATRVFLYFAEQELRIDEDFKATASFNILASRQLLQPCEGAEKARDGSERGVCKNEQRMCVM